MTIELAERFPPEFVWGAATASYQIEGAAGESGRGESIWDRFCDTPGKVRNGDTGAVACDFYHRYPGDIELMRELGLRGFRFSVAWPRILPEGRGRVNEAGLDFYDRLVDALLEAGIEPWLTLYHWDLPQPLEDAGGWPERDTVGAFAEYAGVVARRLGDRVSHWITHNEPWCAAWLGYGSGVHAPGRSSRRDALAAAHNLLLSHGRAVDVLRAEAPEAEVGITLNLYRVDAATDDEADSAAARHVDGFQNRWFLDPVLLGTYPEDMVADYGDDVPDIADGDLDLIRRPLDFLGVNYYSRHVVAAAPDGGRPLYTRPEGSEYTDMGWEVIPEGLASVLQRVHHEYGPLPMYVTENGAAYADVVGHDGAVADLERAAYLEAHLDAVARAIAAGAPVRGYFVWSLLDNFEWALGYAKRFGIVYVDYPTLARIPKRSFAVYRDLIAAARNAVPMPG